LYRNGNAGQVKKSGAEERKVKNRSLRKTIRSAKNALKTEGCGNPAKVKVHKPERSLERVVDMEVSRNEGFEL
jgi:hypothetical protein